VPHGTTAGEPGVRAAEVIGALSLATDLSTGVPFEHGLESALIAMRLCERLNVDPETSAQAYYGCLLFYVGCTADAGVAASLFDDDVNARALPVMFGSRREMLAALARAVAPPGSGPTDRAILIARRLPRAVRSYPGHLASQCEVAEMLTDRLGLPSAIRGLFATLTGAVGRQGLPGSPPG
jgi:hypothetical protein